MAFSELGGTVGLVGFRVVRFRVSGLGFGVGCLGHCRCCWQTFGKLVVKLLTNCQHT